MLPIGALLDVGMRLVDKFFPDPEAKAKAQMELLKMQQDGELAKMANDTEIAKIYAADVASARNRESSVATSEHAPYLNKIVTPVLAIGVLILIFTLFGVIIFDDGVVDSTKKDILIYVMGVLSAIATQIISYYFGSSQGSNAKNNSIDKLLSK